MPWNSPCDRPGRGLPTNNPTSASPYQTALRLLARRAYSIAELRRTLLRRFKDESVVKQTLARLMEAGLADDSKFALDYASFLVRHYGYGRVRVLRELQRKGVAASKIDAAIESVFSAQPEADLLAKALERKIRTLKLPLTQRKFYALAQSLMRLGFRPDDIMKAMRARAELRPVWDHEELGGEQGEW
jgi:regulatory protein